MAQPGKNRPRWTYYPLDTIPASLDIVWCRFPEDQMGGPGPKSRPGLVRLVELNQAHTIARIEINYGTSKLKLNSRFDDLIIQNHAQLNIMGLPKATRFDLDRVVRLPWAEEFFECRTGFKTPVIGKLTDEAKRRLEQKMERRRRR